MPAALIASMIKVAMQSVATLAPDPAQVLHNLNQILTPELRGRLTSAAYLWIDTEDRTALNSAAGHPALLQWNAKRGELLRIEARVTGRLGALVQAQAQASVAGRVVLIAEFTLSSTPPAALATA